jgi:hypothetical protein
MIDDRFVVAAALLCFALLCSAGWSLKSRNRNDLPKKHPFIDDDDDDDDGGELGRGACEDEEALVVVVVVGCFPYEIFLKTN